jgi:hypothetical protein
MIVEGKQINIKDWNPPGDIYKRVPKEGWDIFSEFNSNIPENTPTTGYRIVYQEDGRYYSPFLLGHRENYQLPGTIQEAPTKNGFYYFQDKDVAQNYLAALISRTNANMHRDSNLRPRGTFELHRVEGIAAGPVTIGDEGDRMKEMYIYEEPIISIELREIWPKSDVAKNK